MIWRGFFCWRDKEKERAFLEGNDISTCPVCGNTNMWVGWGTGEQEGIVTALNCTRCGWACGDTSKWLSLRLMFKQIQIITENRKPTDGNPATGPNNEK